MQFTESEQAVLKLFNEKSKMNYQFWSIFCLIGVFPVLIFYVFYPVGWEEIHTAAILMLLGMICMIFHVVKKIISKYQSRIAELESLQSR